MAADALRGNDALCIYMRCISATTLSEKCSADVQAPTRRLRTVIAGCTRRHKVGRDLESGPDSFDDGHGVSAGWQPCWAATSRPSARLTFWGLHAAAS